ncbi:MAG: hypothetical protein GY823_11780 [Flavobacteriaceae bacterium]|nr:hypothetical protein [Flavobacteriaceae bacterium]
MTNSLIKMGFNKLKKSRLTKNAEQDIKELKSKIEKLLLFKTINWKLINKYTIQIKEKIEKLGNDNWNNTLPYLNNFINKLPEFFSFKKTNNNITLTKEDKSIYNN